MLKGLRYCSVAFVLLLVAAIAPATAQFPPTADDPQDPPPVGTPKGKKTPPANAAGPSVVGNWTGTLTQVGSTNPYKFELAITARGADTKYPDLDCTGKLNRVGQSKSYVFFVEVITKGQVDKGGRCPDGTITVARQGNDLAVGWFGAIQDNTVIAYGTLKKK
ncbi:MAG: hypothetical protein ACJ8F3_06180 [Xanthobacteraceae bacterium]